MPSVIQVSSIRVLAEHAGFTWRHPSGAIHGNADEAAAQLIGEQYRRTWHTSQEVCDRLQALLAERCTPEQTAGLVPSQRSEIDKHLDRAED